jgi:hypothetical protein
MLRYLISMPIVEFIELFSTILYCHFFRDSYMYRQTIGQAIRKARPLLPAVMLYKGLLVKYGKMYQFRHGFDIYSAGCNRYNGQ